MRPTLFLLLILATLAPPATAVLKPFQIAWDDASPGITSLADWQAEPAGALGWVTVDEAGHFEIGDERIRFLGVNIGAGDCFPSHAVAEKVAARLARFGINNVRFHHMDADWASPTLIDYAQSTTRNLRSDSLDKLHYFISELKKNGIYSNINLLVSHHYRAADGFPSEVSQMEWKDQQVLSFFNDTMVDLQKEYATDLLEAINPYTGLSLADDPAVSFVEILNENGIMQNWFSDTLDTMPGGFRAELNARWNTWLQERHQTTDALLATWGYRSEPFGPNKIINGEFSGGSGSWNIEAHDAAQRTVTAPDDFDGQPSLKVAVTTAGGSDWHVQINQSNHAIEAGRIYTVSFWARADRGLNMNVGIQRSHTDYAGLGFSLTAGLTTQWRQFTSVFEASVSENNARLNFNGFGDQLATVWLADVRWSEGGEVGGLPDGATLEGGNVPSVAHTATDGGNTLEARRDWVRFLIDLEHRYWSGMNRHIKETIGYRGLVFGTIISNSPPNVQAQLDVVDSHSYWQHPVFPGTPWDPVNWTINNESMVNSPGSSTISGLARQRVKGKPHTVTEYQHPAPMTYSSESPLLIAAYGALQDWDGIWFFAYGTAQNDFISGFFDQAPEPGKMANTLLAASIFRRFDVRPARKAVTMKMTPEVEVETVTTRGSAWQVGDGGKLGVPAELALISRLSLDVGEDAAGLVVPPPRPTEDVFISDTGELVWDTSRSFRGVVTVDTDRTKAVIGFIDGRSFSLGNVTIEPGSTEQDWCTVGLTLLEGEHFDDPAGGRALLITTGNVENTGMIWKDASKNSVGANWGRAPTLVEVIPVTVTLPVDSSRVSVFSLDSSGNRIEGFPVSNATGRARFSIGMDSTTLWYEIVIEPGPPTVPVILQQPLSQTVTPGAAIELTTGASGYPAPTIVWYHDGVEVGAGPILILPEASAIHAGNYQATLTNPAGTTTTRSVQVAVRSVPSGSKFLTNISTRGRVDSGENVMIAGFVVEGNVPMKVLIRGIGPGLGAFGVPGVLEDPVLDLYKQEDGKTVLIASNDNWSAGEDPITIREATAVAGGFPLPPDSLDSTLVLWLEPGVFTAQVSGYQGETGVALVEVYGM